MSPKQSVFVQEYLVDLNATQAAIRAGYSARTAGPQGARLLTDVRVAEAISAARAERAERTGITADRVLEELAKIGFSDMRSFAEWGETGVTLLESETLNDGAAACVAEVAQTVTKEGGSIKFKLHSKVDALKLLGQHLGIFADEVPVVGKILLVRDVAELQATDA